MDEDYEGGQTITEIRRTDVVPEALRAFTLEDEFNEISVDLMIECGSWLCVAANLFPLKTRKWNRHQAVLGGLLTRSYKLASALLDQTCQHRRETTFIFARLAFESLVNIQYLIRMNSEEVFQAFIVDSLLHEKKMLVRINSNIEMRYEIELPIERRMLVSISKTFVVSGLTPEEVTKEAARKWRSVNFYQRMDELGLSDGYPAMFGGPSHHVHGSWQDLIEYHLAHSDDGFSSELAWHPPRPQVLLAIALFQVETLRSYFDFLTGIEEALKAELDDLFERIRMVNRCHEDFLSKQQIS